MSHQSLLKAKEARQQAAKQAIREIFSSVNKLKHKNFEQLSDEDFAEIERIFDEARQHAIGDTTHYDIKLSSGYSFFFTISTCLRYMIPRAAQNTFRDWRLVRHLAEINCSRLIESATTWDDQHNFYPRLAGDLMHELGFWSDAIRYYKSSGDTEAKKRLAHIREVLKECEGL